MSLAVLRTEPDLRWSKGAPAVTPPAPIVARTPGNCPASGTCAGNCAARGTRPPCQAKIAPPEPALPMSIATPFVDEILKPYRANAKYLKQATITHLRDAADARTRNGPLVAGSGTFSIGESCYIDDTGHFNAVEFNICYNQLAYVIFGKCIETAAVRELNFLSFDDFKQCQLPSWLIVSIEDVRFSHQMCREEFHAEISVDAVSALRGTRFFFTTVKFSDAEGVKSSGSVVLAYSGAKG